MALRTTLKDADQTNLNSQNKCPRCSNKLLTIDGSFIKWLTCPKCKYKKLVEKKSNGIKITSLK